MIQRFSLPDTLAPKLQRIELIKDDFFKMLLESNDLVGEHISICLEPDKNIDLVKAYEDNIRFIQSNRKHYDDCYYNTDFLIMTHDAFEPADSLSNSYGLYKRLYKEFNHYLISANADKPSKSMDEPMFRFYLFAELFFNITFVDPRTKYEFHDGLNTMDYLGKYHEELMFKNVMVGDCQSAASIASQSKDTYSVTYEMPDDSSDKDTIKAKSMSEGHLIKLFIIEPQYWMN